MGRRKPMPTTIDQASPWLQGRTFASWREEFDSSGYLIFERVLSQDRVAGIRAALAPYLERDLTGRNDFEGLKTNRVYALLAKSPLFAELAIHPLALAFAEAELGPSCIPAKPRNPGTLTTAASRCPGRARRLASVPSGRSTIPPNGTEAPRSFRGAICGTARPSRGRRNLPTSPTGQRLMPITIPATGRTP